MGKYYVYELRDSRDDSVFYVGKGCDSRVGQHENDAKRGCRHPKSERIRQIWADGGNVRRAKIATGMDEDAAYELETKRIAEIGLINLCNIHPGGRLPIERFAPERRTIKHDRQMAAALLKIAIKTNGFQTPVRWRFCGMRDVPDALIHKLHRDFVELYKRRGPSIFPPSVRIAI